MRVTSTPIDAMTNMEATLKRPSRHRVNTMRANKMASDMEAQTQLAFVASSADTMVSSGCQVVLTLRVGQSSSFSRKCFR